MTDKHDHSAHKNNFKQQPDPNGFEPCRLILLCLQQTEQVHIEEHGAVYTHNKGHRKGFDWPGIGLLACQIFSFLLAVDNVASQAG